MNKSRGSPLVILQQQPFQVHFSYTVHELNSCVFLGFSFNDIWPFKVRVMEICMLSGEVSKLHAAGSTWCLWGKIVRLLKAVFLWWWAEPHLYCLLLNLIMIMLVISTEATYCTALCWTVGHSKCWMCLNSILPSIVTLFVARHGVHLCSAAI